MQILLTLPRVNICTSRSLVRATKYPCIMCMNTLSSILSTDLRQNFGSEISLLQVARGTFSLEVDQINC